MPDSSTMGDLCVMGWGNGTVSITTEITQAECDVIVKKCLNSLDLYAKKIRNAC